MAEEEEYCILYLSCTYVGVLIAVMLVIVFFMLAVFYTERYHARRLQREIQMKIMESQTSGAGAAADLNAQPPDEEAGTLEVVPPSIPDGAAMTAGVEDDTMHDAPSLSISRLNARTSSAATPSVHFSQRRGAASAMEPRTGQGAAGTMETPRIRGAADVRAANTISTPHGALGSPSMSRAEQCVPRSPADGLPPARRAPRTRGALSGGVGHREIAIAHLLLVTPGVQIQVMSLARGGACPQNQNDPRSVAPSEPSAAPAPGPDAAPALAPATFPTECRALRTFPTDLGALFCPALSVEPSEPSQRSVESPRPARPPPAAPEPAGAEAPLCAAGGFIGRWLPLGAASGERVAEFGSAAAAPPHDALVLQEGDRVAVAAVRPDAFLGSVRGLSGWLPLPERLVATSGDDSPQPIAQVHVGEREFKRGDASWRSQTTPRSALRRTVPASARTEPED